MGTLSPIMRKPFGYGPSLAYGPTAYNPALEKQKAQHAYEAAQQSDENKLRGLLRQAPKYKSAIDNKEFNQLRSDAFGKGPMAAFDPQRQQAQLLADQQKQELGNQLTDNMNAGAVSAAGAQANAYSQLAQEGGLSSGARERIAAGGAQNAFAARQQARLDNQRLLQQNASNLQSNLLGVGAQEAQARLGLQGKVADAVTADKAAANQFAQDQYGKRADLEAGILKSKSDARTQAFLQKK